MKNIGYILFFICLLPGTLFAQAPELEETIYVVRQQNRTEMPFDACDPALPFLGTQPRISAVRSDLYSVHTKKTNGSVLKDDLKKVGTVFGCTVDWTPETERGFPTADFGQVWQMTLNGKEYTVTGSLRLRTDPANPPFGFPIPNTGMVLLTSTGTVHKSFATDWPPVVVGTMSGNFLSDPLAIGGYDELAIFTISLYEPKD